MAYIAIKKKENGHDCHVCSEHYPLICGKPSLFYASSVTGK